MAVCSVSDTAVLPSHARALVGLEKRSPRGRARLESTAEGLFLQDTQLGKQSMEYSSTPQLGALVQCTNYVPLLAVPWGLGFFFLTYEFGRDMDIQTTAPSDPCRGCWHETGRKPILWPGNGHEFVEVGRVPALCGYHYQWFWLLSVPPHSSPSLSFSSPSSSGTGHRPGVSDMAPWASPAFRDHKWTPLSICIHLISPARKAARV